ncbi:DUF3109 family protein [Robiginitalea biformata]|uniref:DUF3109 family protein n=1 Tax=Robiginitalea biformata (strain ATCC BAA-864 / DSM 15991 / KCTC 12146 / HTCC2501) TaxID=313596 RepID=A4CHI0_ROBBH|nr:DUF3109 family protein [Robiginitalea biformata]EAR16388.1 hypothetical protein RB2501_05800 [Robiginitalea biformata HTCC2501]
MFELGKTVVSEELFEKHFVCDLQACKGACCVDGSAGAPVAEEERGILEKIYTRVRPFLRDEGRKAIEAQGPYVRGSDGEWETPLVDGNECAYVVYSGETALCGIEAAHREGAIDWKKPLSCHLYPVRIREYTALTAVNYHQWHICDPACSLGEATRVPIYKFVREALVRKFGEAWYEELESVAEKHLK